MKPTKNCSSIKVVVSAKGNEGKCISVWQREVVSYLDPPCDTSPVNLSPHISESLSTCAFKPKHLPYTSHLGSARGLMRWDVAACRAATTEQTYEVLSERPSSPASVLLRRTASTQLRHRLATSMLTLPSHTCQWRYWSDTRQRHFCSYIWSVAC